MTLAPLAIAVPPAASISATTFCAASDAPVPVRSPPRSLTTTFAPRRASSSAYSRPRPPPAPVTIATLSSKRMDMEKALLSIRLKRLSILIIQTGATARRTRRLFSGRSGLGRSGRHRGLVDRFLAVMTSVLLGMLAGSGALGEAVAVADLTAAVELALLADRIAFFRRRRREGGVGIGRLLETHGRARRWGALKRRRVRLIAARVRSGGGRLVLCHSGGGDQRRGR